MSRSSFIEDVYVVIPCYNEGAVIASVINILSNSFKNIVVINDGSTDDTEEVLNGLDVVQIKHPLNLGQGAAIFTGFEFLKRNTDALACVTFDADGQHSPLDAVLFAEEIKKCEEDVIFGSRFLGNQNEVPLLKRLVLKGVIKITNFLTNMSLTDTHNGLKAFKLKALTQLQTNLYRSAFETELIINIAKSDLSYKELPSRIVYTEYSRKKGQKLVNGFIIVEDLVRMLMKK